MITFKSKPETVEHKAHIDVYENGIYVGYIIKHSRKKRWDFIKNGVCEYFANTQEKVIEYLTNNNLFSKQ